MVEENTQAMSKNGRTMPCSHQYGDYVTFDGNLYQIRGNGNKPQLYFISSIQAEIEETQMDASIYTQ